MWNVFLRIDEPVALIQMKDDLQAQQAIHVSLN
jgi:hypothetical protein